MTCTTNLQRNNLQYLLTKTRPKQTTITTNNVQQNSMPSLLQINVEGTDVGREEGLTCLH